LDQATGGVLSQQAVSPTTNEANTAVDLLKTIVLKGRLVTGDAMFCQRELCQKIVDSGGDYLFIVKDNQPELKAAQRSKSNTPSVAFLASGPTRRFC